MPSLYLNGVAYSFDQLKAGVDERGLTPFARTTFRFCYEWLNGKQQFELTTSGSTGVPKRITFQRSEMTASARLTETALGLKPGFTSLLCLDTNYVAGQMMLVRALVTGMSVIAVEPRANPLQHIPDAGIDFAAFVPYQVQEMLQQRGGASRLSSLRTIIIGGATVDSTLVNSLMQVSSLVYATYGMTETLSHIALQRLTPNPQSSLHAIGGISLSTDERGCLVVHVAHLRSSPIVTNDVVRLISPTEFDWLGRWDLVINSGGVKISPERIEQVVEKILMSLNNRSNFFVGGVPDARLGSRVVLIIEGPDWPVGRTESLLEKLHAILGKYEVPKAVCFVPRFRMTASQKIDRAATLKSIASP